MTEIKTSKARILLVEIMEGAHSFEIDYITEDDGNYVGVLEYVHNNHVAWVSLPPGSFSFLCLLDDITEGMAAEIVDSHWVDSPRESNGNRNLKVYNYYTFNQKTVCYTALESFASLLFANNVDGSKNWAVLIEKL